MSTADARDQLHTEKCRGASNGSIQSVRRVEWLEESNNDSAALEAGLVNSSGSVDQRQQFGGGQKGFTIRCDGCSGLLVGLV